MFAWNPNTGSSIWWNSKSLWSDPSDTIVVSSPLDDSSAVGVNGPQNNDRPGSGAAYVFRRSGTDWSQEAFLKASNPDEQDIFGRSVAISGDTIVVGADSEDSNASGVDGLQNDNTLLSSGAAYVFARNGSTWTQQAYLKASNSGFSDTFGDPVAISGDVIVIGAGQAAMSAPSAVPSSA